MPLRAGGLGPLRRGEEGDLGPLWGGHGGDGGPLRGEDRGPLREDPERGGGPRTVLQSTHSGRHGEQLAEGLQALPGGGSRVAGVAEAPGEGAGFLPGAGAAPRARSRAAGCQ